MMVDRRNVVPVVVLSLALAACETTSSAPPPRPPRVAIADTLARAEYGTELTEVMLTYLGSSTCGWSTNPQLVPALRSALDSVVTEAARRGALATTIGIDIDPQPGHPDAHLRTFGLFDQIVAGGGFMNIAALGPHWGIPAVAEGTPQVLVLERTLRKGNARGDPLVVEVVSTRVLARLFGLNEILAWSAHGAPLPLSQAALTTR